MNSYESRKAARIARLEARAAKKAAEARTRFATVDTMAGIMNGQPILIGHHSEKRHRRDIARMDDNLRLGVAASNEATELARRAAAAESSTAISSDNPDAPDLLRARIADLKAEHARDKRVNAFIRKGDRAGLKAAFNLSDALVEKCFEPPEYGRPGIPAYVGQNRNANIRRLEQRLATLERQAETVPETEAQMVGDVRVVENVDLNRCQLFFPAKPSEEIRRELKSRGFRWSPSEGAWQRHRSNAATYEAARIAEKAARIVAHDPELQCDSCRAPVNAATLCCRDCGILHGDPCPACGRRGVHANDCRSGDASWESTR